MTRRHPRVAIVGAGAAGTLTALHLLKQAAKREVDLLVELYDPAADTGRGVAYGTSDPSHLLNVATGKMSAYPDDPGHFLRWLATYRPAAATADGYAPRVDFGRYLGETLRRAAADTGPAVLVRHGTRVTGVHRGASGVRLRLGDGTASTACAVVLAAGQGPPRRSAVPAGLTRSARYVPDPWAPGALDRVRADQAPVLLVGTGLTMVDVALGLGLGLGLGDRHVQAISRTGLLPRAHRGTAHTVEPAVVPTGVPLRIAEVRRAVQRHALQCLAECGDWRPAVDSLRPVTPGLWQCLPLSSRAEFLRSDLRRWEVARHRMAPEVARALGRLRSSGALVVRRGALRSATPTTGGLCVGLDDGDALQVGWVVNCTGPDPDVHRSADLLLVDLLRSGTARRDPLALGLDVDDSGALLDRTGRACPTLRTVGALRRGRLWESTAIPELRQQAADLAEETVASLAAPRRRRSAPPPAVGTSDPQRRSG